MASNKTFFFVIAMTLACCSVDEESIVSFEIKNGSDKMVDVKVSDLKRDWNEPLEDIVYHLSPGQDVTLFASVGRLVPRESFITDEKLSFCSLIELSSEAKTSTKDLLLIEEWRYQRLDSRDERYSVTITADYFNP